METILIVASSGRMLAQVAKNAGLKPLVIDLFADLDTQSYAEDFRRVKSLAEQNLTPAVDYFVERYGVTYVIYGSGFEYYPESLCYLASRLTVLGNQPDVFVKLYNKPTFFVTLDDLNIPHPEVAFSAPDCADGWLIKPMRGQGGVGIKRYHAGDGATASVYWQKFQAGASQSVLFLADGQQVQVVGFNTQWSVSLSETQEFVFSRVINSADLPDELKAAVTGWLKQMVPVFALKGLNSLDFIHAGDYCYVLEINPRPSASMQLYDESLLVRHIKASQGAFAIDALPSSAHSMGYQIVYAEQDLTISDQFEWPEYCVDLPKSGSFIRTGQPICSIIAHQNESRSVSEQLLTKQQLIINKLEGFHRHGIYS